ncbi:uncharacterized protein LOC121506667 isoform X2 [Cheilinus undulatus]|uniref:uncharacterized protein LOC121506667 isoform X2 n=1 Tax=Cheilinus undulatus TaxID=241271 RepID=UPI001BD2AADB|nr:uncharacterized protein LOC121506667 isoform X2 [Cheilinus undulatus]
MWRALKPLGLFYVFLLFFSASPNDDDQISVAVGKDAVLSPPPMDLPIQRIEWKHNEDIAAGWYGDEFECLGQFKGRCEVDTDTGELTIKKINLNDSGIYTPEINGKVLSKTQLSVIPVPVYGAKGEDVILRPPPMTDTIQRIEWKHNENIAAGWYGDESECLGQFEGRCEVNTDTGALTIKDLNLNDSGIYTPEINGKVFNKTQLSVISRVAKPSVETSCDTWKTYCRLTCKGNTAEAEPITYTWFIDGKHGPSYEELIIRNHFLDFSSGFSFRCLMMNPVSNETSESVTNPIAVFWISIFVAVGIVYVVAAYFICKCMRGRQQRAMLERRRRAQNKRREEERRRRAQNRTEQEMRPLNESPHGEGQTDTTQHLSDGAVASGIQRTTPVSATQNGHSGAETESGTPETSNQNPAEAAVSVKMPDKKPETNCEPSADGQEADDRA